MLHALQAFAQAVATEIKDEFTDPEAAIGGNILGDLCCGAGERSAVESSLALGRQRYIVERGFIGDGERFRITPRRRRQALEITQRHFQLMWSERHRRI